MATKNTAPQLAKLLAYILGRRPDEFGLVPDADGFVPIKELLKALSEEPDLRSVRRGHLESVVAMVSDTPVEILEGRIRATDRTHLSAPLPAEALPKLLYTCVRRKAHPVVAERGISATRGPFLVLSSDREMALRIGRRSDATPVVLTVSVQQAREARVRFLFAGGALYLTEHIPATCFTGPPLPKVSEITEARKAGPKSEAPPHPGSFFPDLSDSHSGRDGDGPESRGKRSGWKRERKRMIRMERKKGPRF